MFDKAKEFAEKHRLLTFVLVLIIIFLLYVYFTKGEMGYWNAIRYSLGFQPTFVPVESYSF